MLARVPIGPVIMSDIDVRDLIEQLTTRVDRLAVAWQRAREENRVLRASQDAWTTERATLLAKNEQARARVEAMIARLKQLETHT
jgi:cell division protein ZapB